MFRRITHQFKQFFVSLLGIAGFETTALLAPEGLLKEGPAAGGAVEAFQTPGSGGEQQQGITTISLEEKKILLSLEKLNQQLFCKLNPSDRNINVINM